MMDKPQLLDEFCRTCARGLAGLEDNRSCISFVTSMLEELLAERALFRTILENIVEGRSFPDIRYPTMFENELILHRDPEGHFSLRLYLWDPGEYDPIHDHNSWGVIGPVTEKLHIRTFTLNEAGAGGSAPALHETGSWHVPAGKTYWVLPLDDGIHQTGNPTGTTIIQASLYGRKQTHRSFINIYDEPSGTVTRLHSHPARKRMLAERALAQLE